MKLFACLVLPFGLGFAAPAFAQEPLPAACTAHAGEHAGHSMPMQSGSMAPESMEPGPMDGDGAMAGMAPGDAGHQALMGSMKAMDGMGVAMTAPDVDVAFVCGMIPHHRAAVAMARAELAHGDDAWAKKMAEEIIATQEREIAAMTAWLEKQPR